MLNQIWELRFYNRRKRQDDQFTGDGFIDTFRYFYPDQEDMYTWWSYMSKVRERNIGWRIDYFIASERLATYLLDASIDTDVLGSDHCPVILELKS